MHSLRLLIALASLGVLPAAAQAGGAEPIRMVWQEGDVGGMTTIYSPEGGAPIGFVEYRQTRHADRLTTIRIARFRDGSSDEDHAEARVGERLEAISGRSIVRDPDGVAVVDIAIDVPAGRITGRWGRGDGTRNAEQTADLTPGTYWGPLIFIVLRNFDANAHDGRLAFRTVAPTPRPMVIDLEFTREQVEVIERAGTPLETGRFELNPTIHWLLDPLVRLIAPTSTFWIVSGRPPALARFAGPRNYARQEIVIE
jgi:hypothetical protein